MDLKDGLRQIQPDEGDLLNDPLSRLDVLIDDTSDILGGGRPHHYVRLMRLLMPQMEHRFT